MKKDLQVNFQKGCLFSLLVKKPSPYSENMKLLEYVGVSNVQEYACGDTAPTAVSG